MPRIAQNQQPQPAPAAQQVQTFTQADLPIAMQVKSILSNLTMPEERWWKASKQSLPAGGAFNFLRDLTTKLLKPYSGFTSRGQFWTIVGNGLFRYNSSEITLTRLHIGRMNQAMDYIARNWSAATPNQDLQLKIIHTAFNIRLAQAQLATPWNTKLCSCAGIMRLNGQGMVVTVNPDNSISVEESRIPAAVNNKVVVLEAKVVDLTAEKAVLTAENAELREQLATAVQDAVASEVDKRMSSLEERLAKRFTSERGASVSPLI